MLKMRPSYFPRRWNNESPYTKRNLVTQLWTINGKCPKNSIAMRRTTKEDILRAKSIKNYGKKDPNSIPQHKPRNSSSNPTDGAHEVHIKYLLSILYLCNF